MRWEKSNCFNQKRKNFWRVRGLQRQAARQLARRQSRAECGSTVASVQNRRDANILGFLYVSATSENMRI